MTPEEFVEKWFRCHRPQPCQQEKVTTPAHERIHVEGKAAMLTELRNVITTNAPHTDRRW